MVRKSWELAVWCSRLLGCVAGSSYRGAGRWYERRRTGLGIEFFDAVDAAVRQLVDLPRVGAKVPRLPTTLPVRRIPVKRFPYHVVYLEQPRSEFLKSDV